MSRIKIEIPQQFTFSTAIPIRITDLNYGGHVGNDALLSIIHEARIQYLHHHGYTEINFAGAGLIMADVGIEFKNEVFYGDTITIAIAATNFGRVSFDIYYKLEKEKEGNSINVAFAKTGMVCFDYSLKKITGIPSEAIAKLKVE